MLRQSVCTVILAGAALLSSYKAVHAYDLPAQISPEPLVGPISPLEPVAGGLTIQGVGSETFSYDTNPLLMLQGGKALWGSSTTPEMIINDRTPTMRLMADTSFVRNEFNLASFDSSDAHSTADFKDQKERWAFEIQEHTDYDTTRTSELTPFGGLSQVAVRHLGFSAAPQISFSPTAIDKIAISGSGQYSTYDSANYTDYSIYSISPSYSHNFDPLNAGVFALTAQRYRTLTGSSTVVDSIAPTIGWNTVLTPRIIAKANVGIQGVTQKMAGSTNSNSGWSVDYVFSGDVTFRGESDLTDLSFSRSEFPFSNGTESMLTTIAIAETHAINADFSLNLNGNYQLATYPTSSPGSLDSMASVSAGLAYHATEHVDVAASYSFRYETLVGTSGNPNDHIGTVSLVYRPKPWAL